MSAPAEKIYRFGNCTLSLTQRVVRRDGVGLPVSGKAFELLAYMVQHPGRVLSRDELMQQVWGETVVEERSLNQHVFLLRKALAGNGSGDGKDYIATVSGRGYQFVSPVEERALAEVEPFPPKLPSPPSLLPEIVSVSPVPLPLPEPVTPAPPRMLVLPGRQGRTRWLGLAALLAVLAGVAASAWWWRSSRPLPPQRIELVLASMDNQTGDATLDHALNRALEIDLQQSPSLVMVSDSRIRGAISDMQQDPAKTQVTASNAREICQRVNGNAALLPSIADVAGKYMLAVTAINCETGETLGSAKEVVANQAGLLGALDRIADKVRKDIGESSASRRQYNSELQRAETASLDALKLWSQGEAAYHAGELDKAVPLLQHAVELDPNFAVAWSELGAAYNNLDQKKEMVAATTRAYQLRDRVSDRYRYYIESRYWSAVVNDPQKGIDVLLRWIAEYPHDLTPILNLTDQYTWTGNTVRASETADKAMDIIRTEDLHNAYAYEIALRAYVYNREIDKARAVCKRAEQQQRFTPGAQALCVMVAHSSGDAAEEARLVAASHGKDSEARVLGEEAMADLQRGHWKQAGAVMQEAKALAEKDHATEDIYTDEATYARMLGEMGLTGEASRVAAAMPRDDISMDRGFLHAMLDDPTKVSAEANAAVAAHPDDILVNKVYVPQMRAELQLRAGKPQEAIRTLQSNVPYAGRDGTEPYLMGQALLAAAKYPEARASFAQLASPHFMDEPSTPLNVLAHLQMARAFAREGNTAAARQQYDVFLATWKDADTDIPVLAQARTERAALP